MKHHVTSVDRDHVHKAITRYYTDTERELSVYEACVLAELHQLFVGEGPQERELEVVTANLLQLPGSTIRAEPVRFLRAKPGGATLDDLPVHREPLSGQGGMLYPGALRGGQMAMPPAQSMKAPPGYLEGLAFGRALRANKPR